MISTYDPHRAPDKATALRVAVAIMEGWHASTNQIERTLRVSRSRCLRAQNKQRVLLDRDQMDRISIVLNIHATLRTVFENPKNALGFPSMKNNNEFFNRRSPLEVLTQGGIIPLYETYRRIDALRTARW